MSDPCSPQCNGTWPTAPGETPRAYHVRGCPNDPVTQIITSKTMVDTTIRRPCNSPAPLVVNGGYYAGCSLNRGHSGHHSFTMNWDGSSGQVFYHPQPDQYCVTREDGEGVSTDPRCMHQPKSPEGTIL